MRLQSRTILRVLLLITAFVVVLSLAVHAKRELVWIGTAFFLAVALNPAVDYLSTYMPRKSRGLSITVVSLVAIGLLTFLIASFVPPLVSQSESLVKSFPSYTNQLINGHGFLPDIIHRYNLVDRIRASQDQLSHYASSAGGSLVGVLGGVFSSLAAGVTIIVLSVFMLLEGPRWVKVFWHLVPPNRREHDQELAAEMYKAVSGYVNGNLLTSLIAAIGTALILVIMGVPYAIPLGLFVAIADLIPLVGATIGAVVVCTVAFFTSVPAGIVAVAFFLIYQQVENHVLQPIIYGKTVEVSPLIVVMAIVLGAGIGGMLGALVAIPIAACLQILVRDFVTNHMHPAE